MKRFLKKRWHSVPIGILAVLMALVLMAGSAFAAYGFFNSTLSVEVEEAIVVAIWPEWDNLEPYGSVDDVEINLGGTAEAPIISITTIEGYAGAGFVAGEWIVIPVNFRNAGDGALTLGASVTDGNGGDLVLEYCWRTNTGVVTEVGAEGQQLARDFKDDGNWGFLDGWTATIAGNGGKSGSAVRGAQVLFVRISLPGDAAPGVCTLTVTFDRS